MLAIIVLGLLGQSCGDDSAESRPNVIMIVMDTFRYDHLGCYGYGRDTSPNLDAFASEGIRFSQAIAQASWTLANAASYFTGQYVPTHRVYTARHKLHPSAVTLAEALRAHGYRTGAFTGGFHISSIYGVDQGFDIYVDQPDYGRLSDVLPKARRWIEEAGGDPFFLFIQAYDTHAPFELEEQWAAKFEPAGYDGILNDFQIDHTLGDNLQDGILTADDGRAYTLDEKDVDHIVALYDGSMSRADARIGAFLEYLGQSQPIDDTVIIIMGDHGEALLEHGHLLKSRHGDSYEEGIHVPLMMWIPRRLRSSLLRYGGSAVIDTQVQLIDLMPTILDWLDIRIPAECQGSSLVPLMEGSARPEFNDYVFSSGGTGGSRRELCIRSSEWKLLRFRDKADAWGSRDELYHLFSDPDERHNLFDERPDIVSLLGGKLDAWSRMVSEAAIAEELVDPDVGAIMRERMRQRGYWWLETEKPQRRGEEAGE